MRKEKAVAVIFSAAVAATFLAACGTGKTSLTQTEHVGEIQSTETEGQPSDGTVALTVWGAEEDQALLTEIAEKFKQEYEGETQFEITITAESESTCKDTLLNDPVNGADVFAFVDDQLMSMVAAGVLEPIPNAEKIKSENAEGAITAASVNDTLYAYPMTADNGYFMYYNKAYFAPEDTASLDAMLAVAAAEGKKIVMDWSSGWYLYSFFGGTGLTVGLNDDGITNYCTWNAADGAIKGTDVAEAMLSVAANPGFANMTDADFIAGVQNGSVIAGISGVWNATVVEEAWGSDYGAVKLPTYTCAGKQVQMASFAGYKMIGVNAYSEHADWAAAFAEFMTNEENQTLRFKERGQGPSNINAASSDATKQSPAIQALIAQSEFASLQRIGGKYWDPVTEFGLTMAAGNNSGKGLQELLDSLADEITAQ